MSFSILDRHDAIGWDFDGTLIRHTRSEAMHAYILANPHKKHVIVTFRTFGWQDRVWQHLAEIYPRAPARALFQGVVGIEQEKFFAVESEDDPRIALHRQHDALRTIDGKIYITEIEPYVHWKGEVCRQRGLSVLVDDMRDLVLPGCRKHGIDYIHPDEL